MFRNRSEDRQRKLYVFQGECKGKVFGIVRSTWYEAARSAECRKPSCATASTRS